MTPFPCEYAIFPDGEKKPAAVFHALDDAIDWALERLGADRFSIRHVSLRHLERDAA
jgi:hypothetical protein